MVVSKAEFHTALTEINESYAKLVARIEALEAKVDKPAPRQTRTKAGGEDEGKE